MFLKPVSVKDCLTIWADFARDMALGKVEKSVTVEDTYTLHTIKQSIVNYTATETVCPFMQQGKHIYDVVFRVSNHDVAFQYRLYPQGDTRCCIVRQEATSFVLPEGSTTFLCPQSKPMEVLPGRHPVMRHPIRWMMRWEKTDGEKGIPSPVFSATVTKVGC